MRAGIMGVLMGLTVATTLKNGKTLSSQAVRASLTTEILFIVIFGLVELYD